jgi:hypothetical protein
MINVELTHKTFVLYAAKKYYNPTCIDSEEFYNDLKRFRYVKRLLNRYKETGELSERLILNHLIVIFNCWGYESGIEMLALKISPDHWDALKPFFVFLKAIKADEITGIEMDKYVIEQLRKIKWES